MSEQWSAADLVGLVGSVPGVGGVEPSLGSTLRSVDAMFRGAPRRDVRYGVAVDREAARVVLEVSMDGEERVRDAVVALQRAVRQVLSSDGDDRDWEVVVRVQSVAPRA